MGDAQNFTTRGTHTLEPALWWTYSIVDMLARTTHLADGLNPTWVDATCRQAPCQYAASEDKCTYNQPPAQKLQTTLDERLVAPIMARHVNIYGHY